MQFKYDKTSVKKSQTTSKKLFGGLDGKGRRHPAIADKILRRIENANPHLANSDFVDNLIWKDCVNYKFKSGGNSRPKELICPWPILVKNLKCAGNNLSSLLNGKEDIVFFKNTLKTLEGAPMNVALLKQSNIGKSVKKFIKECGKQQDIDCESQLSYIWTPIIGEASFIDKLQCLLQKWKDIVAASGVEVNSARIGLNEMKPVVTQQNVMDMRVCENVQSWRDLHCALEERGKTMLKNNGAKMRRAREELAISKHRVKKANIKVSRVARHDSILSKSKGLNALKKEGKKFSGTRKMSKISMLKKETQAVVLRSKTDLKSASRKSSMFSVSCANATGQTKRQLMPTPANPEAAYGDRGELRMGPGKKMKMPTQKSSGVFSSVQHQIRVKKSSNRY